MKKVLITLLVLGGLGAAFYTSPRLAALLPFHKAPHVQTAKKRMSTDPCRRRFPSPRSAPPISSRR